MDSDLDHVVALERSLLDPAVRTDPEAVAALLAPDFREVGASGRVWDRAAIVAELAAESAGPAVRGASAVTHALYLLRRAVCPKLRDHLVEWWELYPPLRLLRT